MANNQSAEGWVESSVREHSRGAMLQALTYVLLAMGGMVLWFGVTFGLLFMFSLLLTVLGIGLGAYKYIVIGVYVLQCTTYLFVRHKESGRWDVSTDVEGGVVVTAPEPGAGDHGFVHRGVLASIFFCIPIALEEAIRAVDAARRIRHAELEPLARLTTELQYSERKRTFAELAEQMSDETLLTAVTDAACLPGFQLFANEPQGIMLTSSAIEELATA
jgi:hypothetical protein